MLPNDKDLLLKEKVKLYNNIANLNDCQGRLLAELEVYPTPRIVWEFEILGNIQCNFPYAAAWKSDPLSPLIGHSFSIKEPKPSSSSSNSLGPLEAIRGSTAEALYGDMEDVAHLLIFYLPNTRFQFRSSRQHRLIKILKQSESEEELNSGEEGRYIESPIDDIWKLSLNIRTGALDWLNPQNRNTGTLITTVGSLYQAKYDGTKPETFSNLQTITLNNALERLKHLSHFLSYANGGYIGPLYIQGYQYTQNQLKLVQTQTSCAVALAFQVTPLEQLCNSWVTVVSDLRVYMECFPAFERMMQNPSWQETFDFTLTQYFQATRPMIVWQVAASAAGAALERLGYTILVEEESDATKKTNIEFLFGVPQPKPIKKQARAYWNLGDDPGQENISPTGKRLQLLLERIGLTKARGYNDTDDVQSFLDVRNDAVHPRAGSMTLEQRSQYINQGIQWIDEVLLWRFGYSSEYFDRIQKGSPTTPRYDLSVRDSSW